MTIIKNAGHKEQYNHTVQYKNQYNRIDKKQNTVMKCSTTLRTKKAARTKRY